MLTFSNYFCNIAVLRCILFQGVSIDIEPVERFANGVLVLHLEALNPTLFHGLNRQRGNVNGGYIDALFLQDK